MVSFFAEPRSRYFPKIVLVHTRPWYNNDSMERLTACIPVGIKEALRRRLGVLKSAYALERLKAAGFSPRTVLDLGSYRGDWAQEVKALWPHVAVLMVEAWPPLVPDLECKAATLGNAEARQALLASESGKRVRFFEDRTASCIVADDDPRPTTTLHTTALDDLVRETRFQYPDLIKMDLQGAELQAIAGGANTLKPAEVLQVELNLLPLIEGAPLLSEVVGQLARHNYRLYDLGDHLRRPSDKALWWIDGIFVREGSPLLANRDWQS